MKRYVIMNSQFGTAVESSDSITKAVQLIKDYNTHFDYKYGLKDNQDGHYMNFDELMKLAPDIFNTPEYDLTDDGKGKKYDTGKSMVGTLVNVFPEALMAVGMCIEFGTHKYPNPNNWKQVEGADKRYQDSLMRHLIKHNAGIEKDSETNLLHLAHMAWNALAILQLYIMKHPEYKEEYFK